MQGGLREEFLGEEQRRRLREPLLCRQHWQGWGCPHNDRDIVQPDGNLLCCAGHCAWDSCMGPARFCEG